MKKTLAYLASVALALVCAFSLAACVFGVGNTNKGSDGETYTVTFDAGNGTILGQRYLYASVGKNSTVSEPNQKPECDGYIFIGWNITGSENAETWNFDTDLVERDTTLYAVWAQACEITLEARGGKFDDNAETRTVKAARNSVLTIPAVTPPDANHVLKGWRDAYGTLHKTEYPVTRDMTLTAQWELSDEILTALAPFTYRERDGRITITGVNDKDTVTSLTVPAAVSFIDDNAFEGCISLETVVVDDNVSYIGKNAFGGCAKLKSVTLPTELQEIQE